MVKKEEGYSLMELLMVTGVLLIVLGSGMMAFYKTLRGGAKADIALELDSGARQMMNSTSFLIRHGEVVSLDSLDKDDCLAAGDDGVTGQTLILNMVDSGQTTVSIVDDKLSSSSAGLGDVFLAADGLQIENLLFTWTCQAGQKDQVEMEFTAGWLNQADEVSESKDFSLTELLRNSGY